MSELQQRSVDMAALQFYLDSGVDEMLGDEPVDRFALVEELVKPAVHMQQMAPMAAPAAPPPMAKSESYTQAVELAKAAGTLDALREAIAGFDGLALKRTATNLVFGEGNAESPIMLIGEAPYADDDRSGQPFAGAVGALLDKILGCIDKSRSAEAIENAVYLTHVLNWRPPGGRSLVPAEIELSLPFIERHIQLVKPKLLIICGGAAGKALLGRSESLSKLRNSWHDYTPQTDALRADDAVIPAIVTYNPEALFSMPAQKRHVWADMLAVAAKYEALD